MDLKLKDLLAVNPEANLKRIGKYNALYQGGEAFEHYKDEFIIRRQLECGGEGALSGSAHYEERKKRMGRSYGGMALSDEEKEKEKKKIEYGRF